MYAEMVELVDTRDLKSLADIWRAGSTPALGTIKNLQNTNVLWRYFFIAETEGRKERSGTQDERSECLSQAAGSRL